MAYHLSLRLRKALKFTKVHFEYSKRLSADVSCVYERDVPYLYPSDLMQVLSDGSREWFTGASVKACLDVTDNYQNQLGSMLLNCCYKLHTPHGRCNTNYLMIAGRIYVQPKVLADGIREYATLYGLRDTQDVYALSSWIASDKLYEDLKEVAGKRRPSVSRLPKDSKGSKDSTTQWGYLRGSSFKLPAKQAPWEVDYGAHLRAANPTL